MPTVSINICCYNSEQFLESTLLSIGAQTHKQWELVIVNDGSTDSTEDIVNRFVRLGWPIVYVPQKNVGLGAARNRAIEASSGQYVAFLDHDDLWLPRKLEQQLALFSADDRNGVVYSDCYFDDEAAGTTRLASSLSPFHRGQVLPDLLRCNFIPLSTVVIKRAVLDDVGHFRNFQMVEDWDLLLRAAAKHRVDYVPEPLARYRLHPSQLSHRLTNQLDEGMHVLDEWDSAAQNSRELRRAVVAARWALYHGAANRIFYAERRADAARSHLRKALRQRVSLRSIALYAMTFLPAHMRPSD